MVPAKTQCPTDWTVEYVGYLMSEDCSVYHTTYECVDKNPESVPGLNVQSLPTAYFALVEPLCNGLSCAPYDDEKECCLHSLGCRYNDRRCVLTQF